MDSKNLLTKERPKWSSIFFKFEEAAAVVECFRILYHLLSETELLGVFIHGHTTVLVASSFN